MFISAGEERIVEEPLSEGYTFVGEGRRSGQAWKGKSPCDLEPVGTTDQREWGGRFRGAGWGLGLTDAADLEGGGEFLLQHSGDCIIPAGVGGRIDPDLERVLAVEETIQVNVDADDGMPGQVEGEWEGDSRPVPGIPEMIGEAACGPSLAEVAFHGEKDVAALGSPMEIIEVGVEGMVGRVLVRIGFVGFLVETDVELQDGVVPEGKGPQLETADTARTGSIHIGEPAVAAQPGAGGGIVVAVPEEAGFGEKVGEAGKFDGLSGCGNKSPAGN